MKIMTTFKYKINEWSYVHVSVGGALNICLVVCLQLACQWSLFGMLAEWYILNVPVNCIMLYFILPGSISLCSFRLAIESHCKYMYICM